MKFKLKCILVILFYFCIILTSISQINITGKLVDKSGINLPGVIVRLNYLDSSFVTGTSTDTLGEFVLNVNTNQTYFIKFSYLGYADYTTTIKTNTSKLDLGKIMLSESSQTLKEVEVKTTQLRGEQKGDTLQFNSGSFKTNADATAEDLVKKMPGVTSDANGVKVNGESVQKVLVDGKPFFGDDPNATLKNLPADLIDKVEFFDKMSDQSAFSGFNDGNQQKTLNLVTKKGKNVGYFGKSYAGYGTDNRYNAGANLNSFNNKQRLSLLLLSNSINQQNFSISDITGAMSNTGQSSGRGGGQGNGGQQGGNQGGMGSLLTAPQNGNTTTQSAGLNYSDGWGKKITVSGSYFFNYTDNKNNSSIFRKYFTENALVYQQSNSDETKNQNHRTNFRLEYAIDSANKIIITPSINFQNNITKSNLTASNSIFNGDFLSQTSTNSKINTKGYDFSNSILYQHKFQKNGRTLSLNISTQLTEKDNNGNYTSVNNYTNNLVSGLDQTFTSYNYTKKISANLAYTEPLTKNSQIQLNYNPSYSNGLANKRTLDYDTVANDYLSFNSGLSNKYKNNYQAQKAGLSYKYQKEKLNFNFGADVQQAILNGDQTYPTPFEIKKTFQTILPNAQLNYKFAKSKNLRFSYRSSTNVPSITQLQSVIDISNPLQLKTGNTDLKQTFENNINMRFGNFNTQTSRNIMLVLNGSYVNNYISNSTFVLNADSLIQGYLVKTGSQLTKPVNLNGYYTARTFFVYGFPAAAIKSNLNINGSVTYNHIPSINNSVLNNSTNYILSGGGYIGSNISQKLDFSLSYNATYNIVNNSVQKQSNTNYLNQSTTFKINWLFLNGFVLNTDVVYTIYSGLSQNYNQNYFLWNAYLGYKFLKDKSLEAKVSVFDLLNQNRSIGRTVTGNYTEDYNTTVLKRYFMFTLTYTFKKFKSGSQPKPEEDPHPMRNIPGMPQPPGRY